MALNSGVRFINYNTNQIVAFDDVFLTDMVAINGNKYAIVVVAGGSGAVPATGVLGDVFIPWASTITRWTLLGDQVGSAVMNIWEVPYASYPATVANKITASAPPTLSATDHNQDSGLAGWTTAVPALSTMRFNLDSVATCTRVTMVLELTKN